MDETFDEWLKLQKEAISELNEPFNLFMDSRQIWILPCQACQKPYESRHSRLALNYLIGAYVQETVYRHKDGTECVYRHQN